MAINQNHLFEDLNGVKCAIVEKNATQGRVDFLKGLLEYNRYTVVVVASPPPKAAAQPAKPAADAAGGAAPAAPVEKAADTISATPLPPPPPSPPPPPPPATFTIGVTDVTFNPINAIFGRLLKAPGGHVVTLAYWQQKDKDSNDEVPYFQEPDK